MRGSAACDLFRPGRAGPRRRLSPWCCAGRDGRAHGLRRRGPGRGDQRRRQTDGRADREEDAGGRRGRGRGAADRAAWSARAHVHAEHAAQANGGTGSVTSKENTFALLRIGEELFLKADAGFWNDAEGRRRERCQAADKLGGKYVKVPEDDPAYKQLRGFTEKDVSSTGCCPCTASQQGRPGAGGGVRTVRDHRWQGRGRRTGRLPEGHSVPAAAGPWRWRGTLTLADWGKAFTLEAPAEDDTVDYGGSCPTSCRLTEPASASAAASAAAGEAPPAPAPRRRRRGQRRCGQRAVRQGPSAPSGASRTTRHSRAQRSVISSPSGAFSRLPLSSPTAASHSSEPGASTDDPRSRRRAGRPCPCCARSPRPAPPSASPGSGCSPGPSPTSTAAPSCHTCHSAREGAPGAPHPDQAGLLGGLLDESPVKQLASSCGSAYPAARTAPAHSEPAVALEGAVDAEADDHVSP